MLKESDSIVSTVSGVLPRVKMEDEKLNKRTWRNWQTRWFQVPVKQFMWVQVPSSAPIKRGCALVVHPLLIGATDEDLEATSRLPQSEVNEKPRMP